MTTSHLFPHRKTMVLSKSVYHSQMQKKYPMVHSLLYSLISDLCLASSHFPPFSRLPRSDDMYVKASSTQLRRQTMRCYQDLYIVPHNWTLLHLFAILDPEDIGLIANYAEFKVPFLLDKYGRTPLHYIAASDFVNLQVANIVLKYIVSYLEDEDAHHPFERQSIITSMTPLLLFIISKATPALAQRFLNLCFQESPGSFGEDRVNFGDPKTRCTFSLSPTLSDEVKARIYCKGEDQIEFYSTLLCMDYRFTSDDMFYLAVRLTLVEDQQIFGTQIIQRLIDHLWKQSKPTIRVMGVHFSVLMTLLSVYIGLGNRMLPIEITIFCQGTVILGIEAIQFYNFREQYFSSIWNCFDVVFVGLVQSFIITRLLDSNNLLARAWMSSLILITGYTRWMAFLRLFSSISNILFFLSSCPYTSL